MDKKRKQKLGPPSNPDNQKIKQKPGPKPISEDQKRKTIGLTLKTEIWEKAQANAEKQGYIYRGRVSASAYIENLILKDSE